MTFCPGLFQLQTLKALYATYEKLEWKPIDVLRVSSSISAPFIYQDVDGNPLNGIEYKLFKTIVKKEHL